MGAARADSSWNTKCRLIDISSGSYFCPEYVNYRKHIPKVIGLQSKGTKPDEPPMTLAAWADSVSPPCIESSRSRIGPKWGPHLWHRGHHHAQKTGPLLYISVRWVSGEELAFVRVQPDDHVQAIRHALAKVVGHGNLKLAYRDHLLQDSMQIGSLDVISGSILYASVGARWRTHLTQPVTDRIMPEKFSVLASQRVGWRTHLNQPTTDRVMPGGFRVLPDKESDENLFAARHGMGTKKVLAIS